MRMVNDGAMKQQDKRDKKVLSLLSKRRQRQRPMPKTEM
jgi:hypothetical protein